MASPRVSPESDVARYRSLGSQSIRDKSLLKRNINKHHSNNLSAGNVPVHEEDLHKTGLRGRKLWIFWAIIAVLCVLVVGNFVFLLTMLSVLRAAVGMDGVEIVALPSGQSVLKFYKDVDLGEMVLEKGVIEGLGDDTLLISSEDGGITIDLLSPEEEDADRVMTLNGDNILFENVQSFKVIHPETGEEIFSTNNPEFLELKGLKNLHADFVSTPGVVSKDEDLIISSESDLKFRGNEGVNIEGESVSLIADQLLLLKSEDSIILDGEEGVYIELTEGMKILKDKYDEDAGDDDEDVEDDDKDEDVEDDDDYVEEDDDVCDTDDVYKICVCMPSGKLFRVLDVGAGDECARYNFSPLVDPCE